MEAQAAMAVAAMVAMCAPRFRQRLAGRERPARATRAAFRGQQAPTCQQGILLGRAALDVLEERRNRRLQCPLRFQIEAKRIGRGPGETSGFGLSCWRGSQYGASQHCGATQQVHLSVFECHQAPSKDAAHLRSLAAAAGGVPLHDAGGAPKAAFTHSAATIHPLPALAHCRNKRRRDDAAPGAGGKPGAGKKWAGLPRSSCHC